ncbi:TENN-like protein [Mya arenaria]|uniref:TENN-like protein n=1 Tax=Mya arenaria TaxID=6604 RepID=A0ABY7G8U3_MYAAR|nr:TENN-like protein [Mya arenaria]
MTNRTVNELRWDMTGMDDANAFDQYANFSILAGPTYRLQVGPRTSSAGVQSVQSGNAILYHNGQNFTTFDRDQDINSGVNCAQLYHSGFWFKYCFHRNINPNGQYGSTDGNKGMRYDSLSGNHILKTILKLNNKMKLHISCDTDNEVPEIVANAATVK